MLVKVLVSLTLLAVTVAIHVLGLVAMLRWVRRSPARRGMRLGPTTWLLVCVVWWITALHVVAIGLWAAFYAWQGSMPDLGSALYFSGVTYATIGYGDLVLPVEWRFLSALEGLAGILMCGLSTAFFFAILSRIHAHRGSDESA